MKDFDFNSDLGLYINSKTNLPTTLNFDYENSLLTLLDQRRLPYECKSWSTSNWKEAAYEGIKNMVVRGSQAIGCTAAYTFLLASNSYQGNLDDYVSFMEKVYVTILNTRPTAVNLSWALNRIMVKIKSNLDKSLDDVKEIVEITADRIFKEDLVINSEMRKNGLEYIEDGDVIFTHCNAGSIATSYGGSSLSILVEAYAEGKNIKTLVKETRPRSQGYKLTMWELDQAGVPVRGISDNMVSSAYKKYNATKVFTGADRISRDGYVANKIGTYDLAIIANYFNIPYYVAASYSTLDLDILGLDIPIEIRNNNEIFDPYKFEIFYKKHNKLLSENAADNWPHNNTNIKLYNPAFDVTPANLVEKIILDIGVFSPAEIGNLSEGKINNIVNSIYTKKFS